SGHTSYRIPCQYRSPPHRPVPQVVASERKIQTSLLPSFLTPERECEHPSSTGKPPSQDERALIVDRQSSQLGPGAATSLMVASDPDGRGAVYSRRSLLATSRPHVTTKALPLLPPV